jgi:hypothetical protein
MPSAANCDVRYAIVVTYTTSPRPTGPSVRAITSTFASENTAAPIWLP